MVRGRSHPNRKVPLMRKMTMLLALALLASACVGGGTGVGGSPDPERFCELMEEYVVLIDEVVATAGDAAEEEFADLTASVEALATEAEQVAPEEIRDQIQSTEEEDVQDIAAYIEDECGVDLPEF